VGKMDWNFPGRNFTSRRLATATASLELDTGVEVEVGRRFVEERKRGGRAPGTKGAAVGRAGFLVVEPKNAWSGTGESQTRTQGGAREALEKKAEESGPF
jgi:hypothetical protein